MTLSNSLSPLKWLFFATGVLLLSACNSVPVQKDYNPKYDFKAVTALSWLPSSDTQARKMNGFEKSEPLTAQRIRSSIANHLTSKNIRLSPNQTQGYISYSVTARKVMQADPLDVRIGFGHYSRFGGMMFETPPNYIETSIYTLQIDIHRPNSEVIWRGSLDTERLRGANPAESQQIIDEMVNAILSEFPPQ